MTSGTRHLKRKAVEDASIPSLKREATDDAVTRATHDLRVQQRSRSRLLELPKELRTLILECLFEDEAPMLRCSYYQRGTRITDPPTALVCRSLREECISTYYSRKAFFFNVSIYGEMIALEQWLSKNMMTPQKFRRMKKVTFFGLSHVGQISVMIDFSRLKVVDARWRQYQNLGRPPRIEHYHLNGSDIEVMQQALGSADNDDALSEEARACAAFVRVLAACQGYFNVPKAKPKRTMCRAGKPPRLGPDSYGYCECEVMVEPDH